MAAYDSRGNPILGPGSQSGAVAWLNEVLGWWKYQTGNTSDIYDSVTEAAVKSMQARYGYAQTGVMDEDTWALMDALSRGAPPPNSVFTEGGDGPRSDYDAAPERPKAPTTTPTSATPETTDAVARIENLLRQYGLGGLSQWAQEKLYSGASEAEVELELYDQEAFKARFPVIGQRRAAGLTPVTAAEVIEYETTGRELLRRAGMTLEAFTSQDYLQKLMAADVSPAELNDRVQSGILRIAQAPQEVRNAFGNYFGTTGDAAIAALFLDPDTAAPELEKMATTAFVGGIGTKFNVDIAQGIAREIADTGLSDAAVWQGYAQLDSMRSLFQESISETQDLTAEGEGVAAVFGTRPGAQDTLQRRALTRGAAFKGGGGVAAGERGAVGLGVADS